MRLPAALKTRLASGAPIRTAPVYSSGLAGYATFLAGTHSVSTTYKVAGPKCGATQSGIAEVAFIFAGPSTSEVIDGAGVLDQCVQTKTGIHPKVVAALIVGGVETNFTNPVHIGDTISASSSVGSTGTTVTVKDLTAPRTFTQTLTGTDTASDVEFIGIDTTTINGTAVPVGTPAATKFTASKVDGAAIGPQKPSKVIMNNGCTVIMTPILITGSGLVFSVIEPKLNISSISPSSGPAGTSVTITGGPFNSSSAVTFTGGAASSVNRSGVPGTLVATAPATVKTGPITVKNTTTPIGQVTSACKFTKT